MKDPAMKEKMQQTHKDMSAMMQHMQQMHEQMGKMPCMMGDKGSMDSEAKPSAASDADHKDHHPAQ